MPRVLGCWPLGALGLLCWGPGSWSVFLDVLCSGRKAWGAVPGTCGPVTSALDCSAQVLGPGIFCLGAGPGFGSYP